MLLKEKEIYFVEEMIICLFFTSFHFPLSLPPPLSLIELLLKYILFIITFVF